MYPLAVQLLWSALIWATAHAGTVRLQAEDGQTLYADHSGSGERGVLLVHAQDRSAKDWTSLAEELTKAGHQVLAIDLRGHGRSEMASDQPMESAEPLALDVRAAVDWMRSNGVQHLTLVGAELGANVALQAAASDADIRRLVLLSPGLNIKGVRVVEPIGRFSGRPLMLVASRGDPVSSKAATLLESRSTGATTLVLTEGGARGARMLNTDPSLEGTMLAWLNERPRDLKPDNRLGPASSSTPSAVTTSGTLLEDRN